ncbi:MAG: hypothetical protein A2252_10305 [Elusimicrobia bacterium RIFOXYA2_FULL_39_19]|nr:MAG: hypothetical protein A2252_10305 [Elusimicrobia bacterium RIFOXYA2_FULL_39_19]
MAKSKDQLLFEKNKNLYRLLDANLNRASEGLRVIEDSLRFIYNNKDLFSTFRTIRHKINKLSSKAYPKLILSRDSQRDSGREIQEKSKRESLGILLAANFKRVEQALRVLEEYSKLIAPDSAVEFKKARYSVYNLEKMFACKVCKI